MLTSLVAIALPTMPVPRTAIFIFPLPGDGGTSCSMLYGSLPPGFRKRIFGGTAKQRGPVGQGAENGPRCFHCCSAICTECLAMAHAAISPPSTAKVLPVVQCDSSEAK